MEIGLSMDLLEHHGLRALAQVDLQQRVHRNQELLQLSKIAFAIIQMVMQRLERRRRVQLLGPINENMKLIRQAADDALQREIRDHGRPPMTTIPEVLDLVGLGATGRVTSILRGFLSSPSPSLCLWRRRWRRCSYRGADPEAQCRPLGALEIDGQPAPLRRRLQAIAYGEAFLVGGEFGLTIVAHIVITQKRVVLLLDQLSLALAAIFERPHFFR
jgi:hypothetical protein